MLRIRFSLSSVQPSCGPWSGGTEVVIAGEGLVNSAAAAVKFVNLRADAPEGSSADWSSAPVKCFFDAGASSLKLVTSAAEAVGEQPITARLHVTIDGITWQETSLDFTFYPQMEFAEPKPKSFVVATKGGAIMLPPVAGACVVSASVTVRFVCGGVQLEEVGVSDAAGVTVQAPDFTEPGDYMVLVALNGKQVAPASEHLHPSPAPHPCPRREHLLFSTAASALVSATPSPLFCPTLFLDSVHQLWPCHQRRCWQEKVAAAASLPIGSSCHCARVTQFLPRQRHELQKKRTGIS
jgi:hypothetical protein